VRFERRAVSNELRSPGFARSLGFLMGYRYNYVVGVGHIKTVFQCQICQQMCRSRIRLIAHASSAEFVNVARSTQLFSLINTNSLLLSLVGILSARVSPLYKLNSSAIDR